MKRTIVLVLLCAVCLTGCGGVWMNADYSRLLDQTAELSGETARRAKAGQLDPNEMAAALVVQADVWNKFVAAREGTAR
jgi:hypothetical protein